MSQVSRRFRHLSNLTRTLHISALALFIISGAQLSCAPTQGGGQDTETRVAVVYNKRSPSGSLVARQYQRFRKVAPSHVLPLRIDTEEHISRREFDSQILAPLMRWWTGLKPEEKPRYVVLSGEFPLGIKGSGGLRGTRASIDSELTLLPRHAAGIGVPLEGRLRNPFFAPLHEPNLPDNPIEEGMVLVTRLIGFDDDAGTRLIERSKQACARLGDMTSPGASPGQPIRFDQPNRLSQPDQGAPPDQKHDVGIFLFDQRAGKTNLGEEGLAEAAAAIRKLGGTALLDTVPTFRTSAPNSLLGYASWGSNDSSFRRSNSFRWEPGAIVTTFVSSSARTFHRPPKEWHPGPSRKSELEFGGSTQSLIADWLESGATGAVGNVYEPFLDGCARPDILFPNYFSGRNLAEAAYLSIPFLSWQSLVVGDPLCQVSPAASLEGSTVSK